MHNHENNNVKKNNAEEVLNRLKPFILHCLKINHDINNPLTGIIGYSDFLLEEQEPLSANQREYIKQIMTCADKIEKEINKLCIEKTELFEELNLAEFFPAESLT